MMYKNNTWRGFTLIELLVVVLIIGILSAVAVPQYLKAVRKTRYAEMLSIITPIANAAKLYYLTNGTHPTSLEDLEITISGLTNSCLKNGICIYFDNNISRIYVTLGKGGRTSNGYVYHMTSFFAATPGVYCFQSVTWPGLKPDGMCTGTMIVSNAYGNLHNINP